MQTRSETDTSVETAMDRAHAYTVRSLILGGAIGMLTTALFGLALTGYHASRTPASGSTQPTPGCGSLANAPGQYSATGPIGPTPPPPGPVSTVYIPLPAAGPNTPLTVAGRTGP